MLLEPTVTDLFKAKGDTLDDLATATDDVVAGFRTEAYPLAKGWILDLVEVIRTNNRAAEAPKAEGPAWKRNMVRAAILLAHPVKE